MRFKTASFASVRWTPPALSSERSTSGLHLSAWMPCWKNPLELTTARRRRAADCHLTLGEETWLAASKCWSRPSVACLRPVGKLLTGMPSYRMQRLKFVVECWPPGQVGCSPCPSRNFCFLSKEHDCLRISAPRCDHQTSIKVDCSGGRKAFCCHVKQRFIHIFRFRCNQHCPNPLVMHILLTGTHEHRNTLTGSIP